MNFKVAQLQNWMYPEWKYRFECYNPRPNGSGDYPVYKNSQEFINFEYDHWIPITK